MYAHNILSYTYFLWQQIHAATVQGVESTFEWQNLNSFVSVNEIL